MKRVQEIYEKTEQLQQLLNQEITSQNREQVIGDVTKLIEERGQCMEGLTPPYTDEEQQIGQALIPMNREVEQKMNELFNHLKSEMKQVQRQKKSNAQYKNPYQSVDTADGMFMDSKN